MDGIPRIESQDMSLSDVFKDFYSVPDFQREYVWEQEHVDKLLQDVLEEFQSDSGQLKAEGEYFIGSIVVCPGGDGTFRLIDGQQRMTTSYLFLCVVRDFLRTSNDGSIKTLDGQIAASSMDPRTGEDVPRHRLVLQYDDSQDVLTKIVDGTTPIGQIPETTDSVKHLLEAYRTVLVFLDSNFDKDPKRIKQFLAAFTLRVKLIRIVTPNLAHALKVFETINDRGIGLDAMDLLKNLLFMKTPAEKYPRLKERWKSLTSILEQCHEKPLRFLRYYIMAQYETDWAKGFREEQIYPWFVKNGTLCGIDDDPVGFVDRLISLARAYANFTAGKDPQGNPDPHLKNISLLSGVARQHFILLLAGHKLPLDAFTELTRQIENLLFCYIVTREPTRMFERNFAHWSRDMRGVRDANDLGAFAANYFIPELKNRSDAFNFAFEQLSSSKIQQYRMRYILAKLTQYVEQEAWQNPAYADLEQYVNKSVEIEHILSQTPTQEVLAAFDKPEDYEFYVGKLGNLTLLEQPINASIGNGPFTTKTCGYKQSKFLLTKSLAEKVQVGKNTRVDRVAKDLREFETWKSQDIDDRQKMLASFARLVWLPEIPMDSKGN